MDLREAGCGILRCIKKFRAEISSFPKVRVPKPLQLLCKHCNKRYLSSSSVGKLNRKDHDGPEDCKANNVGWSLFLTELFGSEPLISVIGEALYAFCVVKHILITAINNTPQNPRGVVVAVVVSPRDGQGGGRHASCQQIDKRQGSDFYRKKNPSIRERGRGRKKDVNIIRAPMNKGSIFLASPLAEGIYILIWANRRFDSGRKQKKKVGHLWIPRNMQEKQQHNNITHTIPATTFVDLKP